MIWTWQEACDALGLAGAGPDIRGVSIDTRTLDPGDLFIALRGDPGPHFHTASRSDRDGHAFVADAQRRGAAAAMTHRPTGTDLPELRVSDTLDGLWQLGRAARQRLSAPVFAVTGSSGKTTVRAFLSTALGIDAVAGSLNNFWGVPLSLARTPRSARAAVFEIGTNHPGEIEPLARLVAPDVALVLNVRPAHLEFFDSIEALQREKLSICAGLAADGVAVLPDDLSRYALPRQTTTVTFGQSVQADVQLTDYRDAQRVACFRIEGRDVSAIVPGGGVHRAISLAAVLACLHAAQLPLDGALTLTDDAVPRGRGSRLGAAGITVIDDSYNANPASMAAALTTLATEPAPRTIAILGEMLELGPDSASYHRNLAASCSGIDHVVCVGTGMRALWEALPARQQLMHAESVAELQIDALVTHLRPGDVVLVKGSNRVFWQHGFVDALRHQLAQR